ncbi:MAG: metallophosphoesterase [Acidimicrobiales bacterium]|nr:metallophosphoesterase [Acidimicrobiales bacterium]
MRLVQISDTHLSHLGGITTANLGRIASWVNATFHPDLIVNTGDIVAASPDQPLDRAWALQVHAAFQAPVVYLPGNHDVGEPGSVPWKGLAITSERVAAHCDVFGPDRFAARHSEWLVIGINSELLGSGLDEEDDQWRWLEDQLAEPGPARVLLFSHKPLWLPRTTPSEAALSIPDRSRQRIMTLIGERLAAVGCGHLHRYRRRPRPEATGPLEVWAPSTGFIGQTETESPYFEQLGVVEWHLDGNAVNAWFRAPADLDEREGTSIDEMVRTVADLDAVG